MTSLTCVLILLAVGSTLTTAQKPVQKACPSNCSLVRCAGVEPSVCNERYNGVSVEADGCCNCCRVCYVSAGDVQSVHHCTHNTAQPSCTTTVVLAGRHVGYPGSYFQQIHPEAASCSAGGTSSSSPGRLVSVPQNSELSLQFNDPATSPSQLQSDWFHSGDDSVLQMSLEQGVVEQENVQHTYE
uniref:(California timema) hypothetical protein n=1 Tax=Timema californicum TaxID=61474 RepID=A0A7R9PCI1_TIMCA|nr:unnamed protein product [Timema californicum]